MAEPILYRRVYTCANINNTCLSFKGVAGEVNVRLSRFNVSGDVDKNVGEIVSMRFRHYHTQTYGGYVNYNGMQIRSGLVCGNDVIFSPYQKWNTFGSSPISKWDTFNVLPTKEQFEQLSQIRIQWGAYSNKSDFYYRAQDSYPMTLEVEFYAADDTPAPPKGIVRYRDEHGFVDTQAHVYTASGFKRCIPYYYDGSKWVEV